MLGWFKAKFGRKKEAEAPAEAVADQVAPGEPVRAEALVAEPVAEPEQPASALADLVEEAPAIGGIMAQLDKTFPTKDWSGKPLCGRVFLR